MDDDLNKMDWSNYLGEDLECYQDSRTCKKCGRITTFLEDVMGRRIECLCGNSLNYHYE